MRSIRSVRLYRHEYNTLLPAAASSRAGLRRAGSGFPLRARAPLLQHARTAVVLKARLGVLLPADAQMLAAACIDVCACGPRAASSLVRRLAASAAACFGAVPLTCAARCAPGAAVGRAGRRPRRLAVAFQAAAHAARDGASALRLRHLCASASPNASVALPQRARKLPPPSVPPVAYGGAASRADGAVHVPRAARAGSAARLSVVCRAQDSGASVVPPTEPAYVPPTYLKVTVAASLLFWALFWVSVYTAALPQLEVARAFAWQHLFAPLVSLVVTQLASFFVWLYSLSAAAFARDAAAAKQRAADVAAQEARDAAATKQRADDVAQLRALCNRVDEHFTVTTHQGRSVAAGLARLKTEPASAKPALAWSAAEVRAWFAASARWPQYEPHFARYDGEALFGISRAEQLSALGVLPEHAAPLLADLMALL
jgi:hypothetical protein